MVKGIVAWVAIAASLGAPAHAALYKCVDASGKTTYGQAKTPSAKCTPVAGEVNVVPAQRPSAAPAPTAQPVQAAGGRRDELQGEIAQQEAALADAKKQLQEQENIRLGNEQNYQRVLDRLKPYQDKVAEIEKRLADLRTEQSKLGK